MTSTAPSARLDEHDKTEWWDVARALKPGITEEEFNTMWEEFRQLKAQHARTQELN